MTRFAPSLGAALAVLLLAAPAGATAPASRYDAPGQSHVNVCVRLATGSEPLRFPGGDPTGFRLTDDMRVENGQCARGRVRLDFHELIPSNVGALAFHRGGNGYRDEQNVKYGALSQADLATTLPAPIPSSGGRGAACALADEPGYRVSVRSIPSIMKYKTPRQAGGSNAGASFMHYGDPGADQGDRHDVHYSYLLWSFVGVKGGGHARALLPPGHVVRACDVHSIALPSYDREGDVNGRVTARYVRIVAGRCPLYGWMVWNHNYYGDSGAPAVNHYTAMSEAPPADPARDPDCPVAAPASRPVVTTGDAEGSVVTGTVNPKGVPTHYRFDVGPTTAYGVRTPAGSLAALESEVPVSARLAGLKPETTYHYRVVAASAHGLRRGPDRTFTTPARLPVVRVVLSKLHLSPRRLHRTRSRRRASARILFKLSAPARVRLTFQRHTRHGRWRRVGSIVRRKPAGWSKVRFGGWVGRRPLRAGRYRLRAVATGAVGGAGISRQTRFAIR